MHIYEVHTLRLVSGSIISNVQLAYTTFGYLNAAGDNCILLPTYYAGDHRGYQPLIGPTHALDPERWFIVSVNMIGNGWSTATDLGRGNDAPTVDVLDNVAAQHELLTRKLGVSALVLVAGWSMGGMQALAWAMRYPNMVRRAASWCGTARCWPLNGIFLDGLRATLVTDPAAGSRASLKAFARVYAGWAYSAAFWRDELWRDLGHEDPENLLAQWEDDHLARDPADLLAMLDTWRSADPAKLDRAGRLAGALGRIEARTLLMPCSTDRYFTAEECTIEASFIRDVEMRIIDSPFGHAAGAPGRVPAVTAEIDAALRQLLAEA